MWLDRHGPGKQATALILFLSCLDPTYILQEPKAFGFFPRLLMALDEKNSSYPGSGVAHL